MIRNYFTGAAVAGALMAASVASQAQAVGGYHVVGKATLGGEGRWDYLTCDAAARRIYISRASHVMVVDADTDKVVGDIPDTNGVHGIAIAGDLAKGFTSNGRGNNVTVFDSKTLQVQAQVAVGKNPDAVVYDPATQRVFTMNGGSNDCTAIDAKTNAVAGTVALPGRPEFAVADGAGHLYLNLEDKGEVVALDSAKLTVLNHWSLAPGDGPTGLAIDVAHRRLFSVCANKQMEVLDADTGHLVATVPIGAGPDAAGFDAERGLAFSSNGGDGTLTVVHEDSPDKFSVVETVPTQRGARTMTVDPKTHQVLLITADFAPAAAGQPRARPAMLPGTFTLLKVGQ